MEKGTAPQDCKSNGTINPKLSFSKFSVEDSRDIKHIHNIPIHNNRKSEIENSTNHNSDCWISFKSLGNQIIGKAVNILNTFSIYITSCIK